MKPDPSAALGRLLSIMAKLRSPEGCPWDQAQDFASIAPYTIEEAYEVSDAIARADLGALKDELGDLLLQVVFHAQMADELGAFDFSDVANSISEKMIRRHPHVFGDGDLRSAAEQEAAWEDQKHQERKARNEAGALAGIAGTLPALTHAMKLTSRAARTGFDWPDAASVLSKLMEEKEELEAEIPHADRARMADELGDMLFVMANLARKLDLDAETCLRGANRKFERRFSAMEQLAVLGGESLADLSLAQMEALWTQVKRDESAS